MPILVLQSERKIPDTLWLGFSTLGEYSMICLISRIFLELLVASVA